MRIYADREETSGKDYRAACGFLGERDRLQAAAGIKACVCGCCRVIVDELVHFRSQRPAMNGKAIIGYRVTERKESV
jgi:hypothetical protein